MLVNNKKLEIHKIGNEGKPIIILTGMGCSFYEWYDLAATLGKSNIVILIHRPGLGLSEINTDEIRNTQAVVTEVNDIILQLEITEPVILVGHSYGGLCVQHFAKAYPQKIAGIVLVDSTSVDLEELDNLDLPILNEGGTDEDWMEKYYAYSLKNEKKLRKIINPSLTEGQKQLPLNFQHLLINFQINPLMYKAMYSEINNWKKDADTIKKIGAFPELPLIVIGRDKEYNIQLGILEGFPEWELRLLEDKWEELIEKQTHLSSKSELVFAKKSSHAIYTDRPDVIIEAITKILSHI